MAQQPQQRRSTHRTQWAAQFAVASVIRKGGETEKLLVAVYVSNDEQQNILWTSLEPGGSDWSGPFNINESSNAGVTLGFTGTPPTPTLYFVAHNNTHPLLETTAANRWPPTFA